MSTSQGASSGGGGGTKRKADDIDNLLAEPIDLAKIPPYDPRSEQPPRSVTLTKEWTTLEEGKKQIYELITQPFKRNGSQTERFEGLLEASAERMFLKDKGEVLVCVTGNMGGGKSATLNSLFQIGGKIAREGDFGFSCTLASQSFAAPRQGQKEPFLAEVIFFEHKERCEILASYLRDFFRAVHESDDDDTGDAPQNSDDDSRDEVANALFALFRDQKECRTKKDARRFLEDAVSEDDPDILAKLNDWTNNLIRRADGNRKGEKKSVILTASTAGELLTALEKFTKEPDEKDDTCGPSLWPLVSIIRFHFEDPLTKLGITFMDTPGLTDHSRTRRLSALKFSRDKTHALIVTDVSRAVDDASVTTEVKAMKSRGPDRVIIVSPRSDVISDSTMPNGSKREKEQARTLKSLHDRLEARLSDVDEEVQKCEDEGDDTRLAQLNPTKRKLEVLVKRIGNQEKAHRIKMRAEHCKSKLQEKLDDVANTTSNKPVPVYSISNSAYAQHLQGYPQKNAPVLDVDDTNIPELRRQIFAFPNEARLNEIGHQQNVVIPQLIERMYLYTSRTPLERKADLERHIFEPSKKYEAMIEDAIAYCSEQLHEFVVRPLRDIEPQWVDDAGWICRSWEGLSKNGVPLSVLNRAGHRREGSKNGAINMSGELVDLRANHVKHQLGKAVSHQTNLQGTLKEEIGGMFDRMVESLQEDSNASFVDLDGFVRYALSKKSEVLKYVEKAMGELRDDFHVITRKAVFADEDAYIVEAMLPVYEKVRLLKPKTAPAGLAKPREGWPKYRKTVLKQEVTKLNGIWAAVYNGIHDDIRFFLKQTMIALTNVVGQVFEDFARVFGDMCETQDTDTPDEQGLHHELKENLKKAEELLKGPMQRAYDSLYKDFR